MEQTEHSAYTSTLIQLGQLYKYKETRKMILPKNYCSHDTSCIVCRELFKWFKIAVEDDSVDSADNQNNLAICYLYGIGVQKSSLEAAIWFGKAAATGHVFATRSLEILFKKLEAIYKLDSSMINKEETDEEEEEKEAEASDPI